MPLDQSSNPRCCPDLGCKPRHRSKLRGQSGTAAGQARISAGLGRARAHHRPGSRIGSTMTAQNSEHAKAKTTHRGNRKLGGLPRTTGYGPYFWGKDNLIEQDQNSLNDYVYWQVVESCYVGFSACSAGTM